MKYKKPLTICLEGRDKSVRTVGRSIEESAIASPEMQPFYDDLIEAMIRYDGIGIAANQVGYPLQIFVIHKDYAPDGEHLVLINPRIVSSSAKLAEMDEGCLSVPGVFGPVDRFTKVRVKARLRDGSSIDIKAKGMLARILQHEADHLVAKVFIDRAHSLEERQHPLR